MVTPPAVAHDPPKPARIAAVAIGLTLAVSSTRVCDLQGWRGLNSLPLPGTVGNGPSSFLIQAEMPDINNIPAELAGAGGDA